ncbi:hypothetical protein Pelo_15584 [Pelomyxa schiedti]|nr:hypothetical protein Pelo_15584 [Pelomyxa schiedti]
MNDLLGKMGSLRASTTRMEDLTPEQIEEFREAFSMFDPDGSGTITVTEVAGVLRSLGLHPSESELQALIRTVDTDGSGTIEFPEFCMMMSKKIVEEDNPEELRAAFREVFDKNGDGEIDMEELRRVLPTLGETLTDDQIVQMIKEVDVDGDGKISFDEFVQIMTIH